MVNLFKIKFMIKIISLYCFFLKKYFEVVYIKYVDIINFCFLKEWNRFVLKIEEKW